MRNQWSNPKLTETYTEKGTDPNVNWYEYAVNLPDLFALIPSTTQTLLDFGSGPGNITNILSETIPHVEGCDSSLAMLKEAKHSFPSIKFFEWDGLEPLTSKTQYYDAVFSKLTVHFVEALGKFAYQMGSILKPQGNLIFSVPHPIRTIGKIGEASYWQQVTYEEEIGTLGVSATFIHRSLQNYVQPFTEHGFVLTALTEPTISSEQIQKYRVDEDYAKIPRRLNCRFQKTLAN